MDIQHVDLFDDAQCRQAYAVMVASRAEGRPWDRADGFEQCVAEWRYDDKAEPMEKWAATESGRMLGVLTFWLPEEDNTDKIWFQLDVDPAHRRHGVGGALLEHLAARAHSEGRTELLVDADVPPGSAGDHPYERFATSAGYALSNTEINRHLSLPVAPGLLDRLREAARPHWEDGYHLETHEGGLPEHLVPSYCDVSNQLAVDAPTGVVDFEAESLTPERYRGYIELEAEQQRQRVTTVAVHSGSGHVVAYTDVVLPSGAPTRVWQWGTLVHREHRGHRLGTAVKVENLHYVQQHHRERELVTTSNDETNRWMVEINERLGFEVVELLRCYHRVLT